MRRTQILWHLVVLAVRGHVKYTPGVGWTLTYKGRREVR